MITITYIKRALVSIFIFSAMMVSVQARPPMAVDIRNSSEGGGGPQLAPSPVTVDQVVQNVGNIVTTIDNWGYIGGFSFLGLPSGEWPRNSGHNYIGELKYWMGATVTTGDTLVANSLDDFQGMSDLATAANHRILLSTDTTRYYSYNPTDTVGLGVSNAANGWRVWNADSSAWIYNQNYNPLTSQFAAGGPTSFQQSFYRFNDVAFDGSSLMDMELTQSVLQWNLCYNEDFMFVILDITNKSAIDYTDFVMGVYVDIDVGGDDGMGENGRLNDMVGFDSTENLAWTYDVIGTDPGWGPTVTTGYMGTKLLQTPDNIGMTAFRNEDWNLLPNTDAGRYAMINSTQFDQSLPPTDQLYIQCTRGINLTAGKTVRVVYALIAGQDEAEFRANAALAQQLFDNFFVGPQPPTTPRLTARAVDRKVYLNWTDTSEVGLDPLTGENDFAGYKLYRSDNQGKTWGEFNYQTGNNCLTVDFTPISLSTVSTPGDPISHNFIDTGLFNGVEYWYTLVAFDTGSGSSGVDPLQSGFGVPDQAPNIVRATPRSDPAGGFDAAGTVTHQAMGTSLPSDGNVIPILFDRSAVTATNYEVHFEDQVDQTFWHLIKQPSGDTVLANQTLDSGDPGLFEVADGLRVVVRNADRVPRSMTQTAIGGASATLVVTDRGLRGLTSEIFFGTLFGDMNYRPNYELRYTGQNTVAEAINVAGPFYNVPFEVWNMSTNQRVSLSVYDFNQDGIWQSNDLLAIVNYPYDSTGSVFTSAWPNRFAWLFSFDASVYNPTVGDVFTFEGPRLNGPDDVFAFSVDGVNAGNAAVDLKNIKVVPNPYFGRFSSMVETNPGESVLMFNNLPDRCTIRIYTVAGDLVETIEHTNGTGTERWNLLSMERRQIASGLYLFQVDSPYGQFLGRFAVIK